MTPAAEATESALPPAAADDLFLAAANHEPAALRTLAGRLRDARPRLIKLWPPAFREAWHNGLEIVLDGLAGGAAGADEQALLLELLASGHESPRLRDQAAAAARRAFADYPDPAGLLRGLGLNQTAVPTEQVRQRWETMEQLKAGLLCHHPVHGLGTVKAVDGFSSTVTILAPTARTLPLDAALDSLVLIRASSYADRLLRKRQAWNAALDWEGLRQTFAEAVVPAAKLTEALLEALLVPGLLTTAAFTALRQGHGVPAAQAAAARRGARAWHEARNLEELADLLAQAGEIEIGEHHLAAIADLFIKGAGRRDIAHFFAQSVAHLWRLADGAEPIRHFLAADGIRTAGAWQDAVLFTAVTDDLNAKLLPAWFAATVAVPGAQWLANTMPSLPLRLWTTGVKALEADDQGIEHLRDRLRRDIARHHLTADAALWLYKGKQPERDSIANATLLFKTLALPVRGSHLKAFKELRKLILEDDKFQRFLLHDGSPDAVRALVHIARYTPTLDAGERQSLLIRIVRHYPDAKSLVEQRAGAPTVRALGLVTSPRSMRQRHQELDEIVNVKIPENSRAIAHARGYGDLRENAEYKYAKEMQRFLGNRRLQLEKELHEIKPYDFSSVEVDENVIPGSVAVLEFADGHTETLTVLGLWDGDPEKRFLSFKSPFGEALLSKKAGDHVTLPDGGTATVREVRAISEELAQWLRGEDLA